MREWLARLRDWFRRDALDAELKDELRFHRAQLERDAGPDEAPRRFGNETRVREETRDRWSIAWLDILQQDVRYALRGLRRSPAFTITVVLTLGLGIGANAAMFGVIDQLMFRPFPYLRDPATVHRVYLQIDSRGRTLTNATIPYTRYLDITRASDAFAQYAGVAERQMAVGAGPAARERLVAGVSASFFGFFDARMALGRSFDEPEDVTPRGADVVVLGHGFWRSEFGGRDVLDQVLRIGTIGYTIIGVAPEGFVGVGEGEPPAVFVPITTFAAAVGENPGNLTAYFTNYNWDWMSIVVRRKPGVTESAASADLTHGYRQSRNAQRTFTPGLWPDSVAHPRAIAGRVRTSAGPAAGLESRTLLWVTGVAVIVLLIACANVANLMFARVLRRRREIAVRLALGVSRRRLVGQFFTESLLLASFGCLAGLAISQWGGLSLRRLVLPAATVSDRSLDWRTLALAAAFALAAGMLTAVGPALLAVRGDLAGTLKAGVRDGTQPRSRTRSALLILQGALSVVLLVGAALFVRSLGNVRAMRLGYDPEPLLLVAPNYRGLQMDSSARVLFQRRLLEAAQAIPGVSHAARFNTAPFSSNSTGLRVPGVDSLAPLGRFNFQLGTPDYFTVMGTRIIRGRPFTAADREGTALVAVVTESMGRVLWPGRDPIGQCIQVSFSESPATSHPCTTIIGIAEDVVQSSLTEGNRFMYFLPLDQANPAWGSSIVVRTHELDAAPMAEAVRRALSRLMPGEGYVTVEPVATRVDRRRRSWQLGAAMFVAFGALALLVAAVGLYGVIAYDVAQRMHELGVRIALGARSRDVVKLVVGQGLSFAVTGVAIGLGVALVAARWIQPLLFQQSAKDPVVFGFAGVLLLLVAALASAAPAWRATRADPNTALRSD